MKFFTMIFIVFVAAVLTLRRDNKKTEHKDGGHHASAKGGQVMHASIEGPKSHSVGGNCGSLPPKHQLPCFQKKEKELAELNKGGIKEAKEHQMIVGNTCASLGPNAHPCYVKKEQLLHAAKKALRKY